MCKNKERERKGDILPQTHSSKTVKQKQASGQDCATQPVTNEILELKLIEKEAKRGLHVVRCSVSSHLLRLFGVSIGLGETVGNTVGRILEALDGRLLLISIDVELDEQQQVAGENTASKQGS